MTDIKKTFEIDDMQSRIFNIRGKQVMMDRDLAELYGVETKALNQAVRRNPEKFPERFCFRLEEREKDGLVTNCDRFAALKHSSSLPYAFTESGVAIIEGFGYEVVCIFEDGAFSF
ncbi:ORF6N domain-containing protein [Pedobacter ginsengisoli]|uniref:ORF6N domain-containing protein n=1 Tax=Pedobacter ginsengisoli TaxID=363852 RepID=UPI00254ECC78|nr:ORF6N domain-containing protein [Pedobacter ginsengisoli]